MKYCMKCIQPLATIYMYTVVLDFLIMDGALTCKTQLHPCWLVLLVYPVKSNWWCSTLYGLLNKQICQFATLQRYTLTLLSRMWIWNALDQGNQDPPSKAIRGCRQTGREILAQERKKNPSCPTTRAWLRCAQCWWQMLLSSQIDFFLFITSSPHIFEDMPMLCGLQRCCYLEVPSSQEKWICKTLLGSPGRGLGGSM